jgi:hypothetical protein
MCSSSSSFSPAPEALFEQNVVEIRAQIRQLKSSIDMSRLIINEHCLGLARQVDMETETKLERSNASGIEILNGRRKKWLRGISEYETECVQHMEATKGLMLAYIGLTEQWLVESHAGDPSLDRSALIIQQSSQHLIKMTRLGLELKGFQFGSRLLLFSEEYLIVGLGSGHCSAGLSFKELRVPQVLEQYYKEKAESSRVIFIYISKMSADFWSKYLTFITNKQKSCLLVEPTIDNQPARERKLWRFCNRAE